jgi:hypothetical protein
VAYGIASFRVNWIGSKSECNLSQRRQARHGAWDKGQDVSWVGFCFLVVPERVLLSDGKAGKLCEGASFIFVCLNI